MNKIVLGLVMVIISFSVLGFAGGYLARPTIDRWSKPTQTSAEEEVDRFMKCLEDK